MRRRARNRVSARARRRRQKDVRLALTARLNVLEDAVDALERYEWGANRLDVPRFQKAFSVDVFAPKLPSSASVLAAATVLAELALANVDCIRDCLVDNEAIVLASLACDDDGMPRSVSVGSDLSDVRATTRSPISESGSVLYELQEHLDLNPKQVSATAVSSILAFCRYGPQVYKSRVAGRFDNSNFTPPKWRVSAARWRRWIGAPRFWRSLVREYPSSAVV